MLSANDVAAYIIKKQGKIGTIKLQKLLFYCQGWSLVYLDRPLFSEPIQAWRYGPVVPAVFQNHKGLYSLDSFSYGNADALNEDEKLVVNNVLDAYGALDTWDLVTLTHREESWKKTRGNIAEDANCSNEITLDLLQEEFIAKNFHA